MSNRLQEPIKYIVEWMWVSDWFRPTVAATYKVVQYFKGWNKCVCFFTFSAIFWVSGGVDSDGNHFIYKVLDYRHLDILVKIPLFALTAAVIHVSDCSWSIFYSILEYPATAKAGAAPQNLKKNLGAKLKRFAIYNNHRLVIFCKSRRETLWLSNNPRLRKWRDLIKRTTMPKTAYQNLARITFGYCLKSAYLASRASFLFSQFWVLTIFQPFSFVRLG